jgi:hypothetical protein
MKTLGLAAIVLASALGFSSGNAYSQEPAKQEAYAEQTLSREQNSVVSSLKEVSKAWDQKQVDVCNRYFMSEKTTKEDMKQTLNEYFKNNEFTNDLSIYLGYPCFWWGSENTKNKLSSALLEIAVDNVKSQNLENPNRPVSALNFNCYISNYLKSGKDEKAKYQINEMYKQIFSKNKTFFDSEKKAAPGYSAVLKAQMCLNFKDSVQLTTENKKEIAEQLNLNGTRRQLWDDFSIIALDNSVFSKEQLEALYSVTQQVPEQLRHLEAVTQNDSLGKTAAMNLTSARYMVNVFNVPVGTACGDEFGDKKPNNLELFTEVYSHEYNHIVDAYLSEINKQFSEKKKKLIERAGESQTNYLRCMIPNKFFKDAPQEFFASISNMYFGDTERSFLIAVDKLNKGNSHPIDQFLLFAESFSLEQNTVPFYELDKKGKLTRNDVKIKRNSTQQISEIQLKSKTFVIDYDSEGFVKKIN